MTDREFMLGWFEEAWSQGLWAAPWSRAIEGLSTAQALWVPQPGRHCIWQLVLHMTFWREAWLERVTTGKKPTKEAMDAGNFPTVADTSDAAWAAARQRFADTQARLLEALRGGGPECDALYYILPHDCHHFGQVNLLRVMQGLPAIE